MKQRSKKPGLFCSFVNVFIRAKRTASHSYEKHFKEGQDSSKNNFFIAELKISRKRFFALRKITSLLGFISISSLLLMPLTIHFAWHSVYVITSILSFLIMNAVALSNIVDYTPWARSYYSSLTALSNLTKPQSISELIEAIELLNQNVSMVQAVIRILQLPAETYTEYLSASSQALLYKYIRMIYRKPQNAMWEEFVLLSIHALASTGDQKDMLALIRLCNQNVTNSNQKNIHQCLTDVLPTMRARLLQYNLPLTSLRPAAGGSQNTSVKDEELLRSLPLELKSSNYANGSEPALPDNQSTSLLS